MVDPVGIALWCLFAWLFILPLICGLSRKSTPPQVVSDYQNPQKRERLDEILDHYKVPDGERVGFWNSDWTRIEYVLRDGRTISVPFRVNPETGKLECEC